MAERLCVARHNPAAELLKLPVRAGQSLFTNCSQRQTQIHSPQPYLNCKTHRGTEAEGCAGISHVSTDTDRVSLAGNIMINTAALLYSHPALGLHFAGTSTSLLASTSSPLPLPGLSQPAPDVLSIQPQTVVGCRVDLMISVIFSNLNDSMIKLLCTKKK